jgi:membrane-associated protein
MHQELDLTSLNLNFTILYNIFGGIFWVALMLLAGYFLGGLIPNPDKYIIPIAFLIIILSFIPIVIKMIRLKFK